MKKIFAIFFILSCTAMVAQQEEIFKIRKYRVAYLSDSLRETSGLNFFNGKLYTFNDSGNPADIYEIDKNSGKVLKIFKTKLQNKDWEALTNDGKNIYVGDFGNNSGSRKDLKIYSIPFKEDKLVLDSVQSIHFYYPEQQYFNPKYLDNDFDAEAMIFLNGKLHIFTKEWISKSTTHYVLNFNNIENQPAEKIESFKTGFVVTDASYFQGKLYLVGYTKTAEVFLEVFEESEPNIFFKKEAKKYYLGIAFSIGQIEGIAVDETGIYISGEAFKSPLGVKKQSFYFIPKEKFK